MSDLSAFTDEQLFAELERLCRQPVRKLKDFCTAMTTWAECIKENKKTSTEPDGYAHGSSYADHLDHILLDIHKSSLLCRLIYNREPLRTKKCPEHGGHWRGIFECEHGCWGVGWLP